MDEDMTKEERKEYYEKLGVEPRGSMRAGDRQATYQSSRRMKRKKKKKKSSVRKSLNSTGRCPAFEFRLRELAAAL